MGKKVWLKEIEDEYKLEINKLLESENELDADNFIELSIKLYDEIKVKRLSKDAEEEADMLLFQYGIYESDENDLQLHFDITRQFIKQNEAMCQLSFKLYFDSGKSKDIKSYNSWNTDFPNNEDWVKNLKATNGYNNVKSKPIVSYRLAFWEV